MSGVGRNIFQDKKKRRAAELDRELAELETDLNEEKKKVLRLVLKGEKSVFFTGAAGTGKSYLLERIIKGLEIKYLGEVSDQSWPNHENVYPVAITASTGLAAYSIKGTTLHRFAGIGTGTAPVTQLMKSIKLDKRKKANWEAVKTLVIDEISMISAGLFNKLDIIAREIREDNRPFGGIQLVITGDFFQLPPVTPGVDDGYPRFCFESRAWQEVVEQTLSLTQIYRQEDIELSGMLNEIRYGEPSTKTINTFKWLERPLPPKVNEKTEPVELYPRRWEAENANKKCMDGLPGATWIYTASESGRVEDEEIRKRLLSDCIAPEKLQLKKGAQVMLIKNINGSGRLVNGAQGCIIGFACAKPGTESKPTLMLRGENGEIILESLPTDLDMLESDLQIYPVVQFDFKKGRSEIYHCVPETWTTTRWKLEWIPHLRKCEWVEEILAERTQVPLILSWALSIHKAQGQSLDLVRVDLKHAFESGQAYVALSRAKTIEGLQVLNFDPRKVYAHPKVKAFYDSLSMVATAKRNGVLETRDRETLT